jgi:hypothetical protein
MKKYQIWIEGYCATGGGAKAKRLTRENEDTLWEGETFQVACENALRILEWDMSCYNPEHNSYWACEFFDNEADARKHFG